jgi:hypothetical protein
MDLAEALIHDISLIFRPIHIFACQRIKAGLCKRYSLVSWQAA